MRRRAIAPVVGVTTMVLVTVVLAALVGGMFFGLGLDDPPEAAVTGEAKFNVTTGQTRVDFMHVGGDTLDVEELDILVSVGGEALDHQPPVPFFSVTGFEGGPTGPFNTGSSDTKWDAGERAGFTIAGSNDPVPTPGEKVTARLIVDGYTIATVTTTVV